MIMMTIENRIKQARKDAGLTQAQLAEKVGVSKAAVSLWENSYTKSLKHENLLALEKVTGCRARWIVFGEEPRFIEGEPAASGADANVAKGPEIRRNVPVISWVQAGQWSEIIDNFHPGDAEEWLPCPVNCGPHTYVLRVQGISMEPRFREGELIFVDPDAQPDSGKFVVVRLEDTKKATFKQLIIEGGKRYLKALNPDWPEPIIEVNSHATVCGVVVFKGEKL